MATDFQLRLLSAMADKQVTASELSRLSGVGKSDISNYINGVYIAKQDKCYLLAKALNVDPGWLMTGDKPLQSKLEPTFTTEEEELLYRWREAPNPIKTAVRKLLDMN